MDELPDHFKLAFTRTVRRVKTGYRLTKKAFKCVPLESLQSDRRNESKSGGNIHSYFQSEPNTEGDLEGNEQNTFSEGSDVESLDGEFLTDEQVESLVDHKFFDSTYDAVRYELTHMTPSHSDNEDDLPKEGEIINPRLLDLIEKCSIITKTLKKRVYAHHVEFIRGVEEVRRVNESLLEVSSNCKKARMAIRKSKAIVASQVVILVHSRRRANMMDTLDLLAAMKQVIQRRDQLSDHISTGKLVDAVKLLKEERTSDIEDRLVDVRAVSAAIEEWRSYQTDCRRIQQAGEAILGQCLTHSFVAETYCNLVASSTHVGSPQELSNNIAQLLWCIASEISTKCLLAMSELKNESASIANLVEEIQPQHLVRCICQMGGKLLDFFYMYGTIIHLHTEESCQEDLELAAVHANVLQSVVAVGRRISNDILLKLTLIVTHAKLYQLEISNVLHLFLLLDMLIEALRVMRIDKAELEAFQKHLRASLNQCIVIQVQLPKATEVLRCMTTDTWTMSDFSALSLNVPCVIIPKVYQGHIDQVRNYMRCAAKQTGSSSVAQNPFNFPDIAIPQQLTDHVKTETFIQHWTRAKKSLESETPSAIDSSDALQPSGIASQKGSFNNVHDLKTGVCTKAITHVLSRMLVARVSMPPTVLTSSLISLCSILTQTAVPAVIRYPPVAGNMLSWTSDLVSLYIYTVADNFVSISKSVPIERQSDFSRRTQDILAAMHVSSERAAGAVNGYFNFLEQLNNSPQYEGHVGNPAVRFPPRVWERIRDEYASRSHYYALVNRVVACESCIALIFHQEAFVWSLSELLPSTLIDDHLQRVRDFRSVAMELLHMCIYRVSQAIYPIDFVCAEIAKLKSIKSEAGVEVSRYVRDLTASMKAFNDERPVMPTPALDTLFLQRFIFTVQATLLRAYSRLSKRKLKDMVIMQIQVDVQNFHQQVAAIFGRHNIVMPDYVLNLIKTGFYIDNREKQLKWLSLNHAWYFAPDLVNWLSGGDRLFRQTLEETLESELDHHDAIPMDGFLH